MEAVCTLEIVYIKVYETKLKPLYRCKIPLISKISIDIECLIECLGWHQTFQYIICHCLSMMKGDSSQVSAYLLLYSHLTQFLSFVSVAYPTLLHL